MRKLLFSLIVFLFYHGLTAQTFPVQVTTALRPPYSLELSDYANPSYDRIQANIYMADLTQVNYRALVRLVITGPGGIEISTKPGSEVGPVFLNGGSTEILTGNELNELFRVENLNFVGISLQEYQRNGRLPEGLYQFHFEIRDFNNPQIAVSTANTGFATAFLILNDPPIINKPQNEATIVPQTVQNIFFQWTPRHTGSPNAAFTTEYQLQLVEIYPKERNANDAMLSSPPIFETTTFATAYNYSMIDPYLIPDRWYAFRVRAFDTDGRDFFKNQGYSEVYKFYYGQKCPLPELTIEQLSEKTLRLNWDADPTHLYQEINYRPKNKEVEVPKLFGGKKGKTKTIPYPWLEERESGNSLILDNLDLSEPYEFTIQGVCQNNESEVSEVYDFVSNTAYAGGACSPVKVFTASKEEMTTRSFFRRSTTEVLVVDWEDIPGALYYDLYIKDPAKGVSIKVNSEESRAYFKGFKNDKISAKESGTKYYLPDNLVIKIDVLCENGSTTSGHPVSINLTHGPVFNGPCELPAFIGLEATLTNSGAEISWRGGAVYSLYKFRYRELGTAWKEIETTKENVLITGLDPRKVYEYQIIYLCKNGEDIYGPIKTFELELSPDYVAPTLPLTGACFEPSAIVHEVKTEKETSISWEKEDNVKGYEIMYREKGVSGANWTTLNTSKEKIALSNLKENTVYEYQIRSECTAEGKYSRYSDLTEFNTGDVYTYDGPCLAPDSIDAKPLTGTHTRIDWKTEEFHTGFLIQLRVKGSTSWYDDEAVVDPKIAQGLNPETTYEYKIASRCGVKTSTFSAVNEFTTLGMEEVAEGEFVCGMDANNSRIENQSPIDQLSVGDKFTAADFEVEVKELAGGPPYNGTAMTRLPYLRNSYVSMVMEEVQVNTDNQMYSGRIIIKGIQLNIISEELKNKINGYITQINDSFDKADQALAYAQAIEDGLNEVINEINEPIDYSQYEGWTFKELMAEAERLMNEGKAMINSGVPDDLIDGLKMVKKAVELIKMAAALGSEVIDKATEIIEEGNELVNIVKNYIKAAREKNRERLSLLVERHKELTSKYSNTTGSQSSSSEETDDFIVLEMQIEENEISFAEMENSYSSSDFFKDSKEITQIEGELDESIYVHQTTEKMLTIKELKNIISLVIKNLERKGYNLTELLDGGVPTKEIFIAIGEAVMENLNNRIDTYYQEHSNDE